MSDSNQKHDWETSENLLWQANRKDPRAWYRIVRVYTPLIDYWIRKEGVTGHDLENIRQEVFARLSHSLSSFSKADGGTFRGWLRTVTKNLVSNYRRKKKVVGLGGSSANEFIKLIPSPNSFSLLDSTDEKHPVEQQILFRRIMDWIRGNFSTRHTDVFTSVVLDCRAPRDVAADMHVSVGVVYKTKCRILSKVRQEFRDFI